MKFLIAASFLLVCTAAAVTGTYNIAVNGDGTVQVTSSTGNQVTFAQQNGLNGQSNIEIAISGPYVASRSFLVQGNVQALTQILQKYQGSVSQSQYQALLARINSAVQNGQINPVVFTVLQQGQGQQGLNNFLYGYSGYVPQTLSNYLYANAGLYTPNSLYARIFPQNQQYYNYVSNVLGGSGYQSVPQTSGLYSSPLLRAFFGQNQINAVQQPIQTIQQAEQTIQQLEGVQQQLQQQINNIQQQQQVGVVTPVQQVVEQQLNGAQQAVQQVEQQEIGQIAGAVQQLQQQGVPTNFVQQLLQNAGVQQFINQLQGQYGGVQQFLNQLQGQGQQYNFVQQLINQLQGQQYGNVQQLVSQLQGPQGQQFVQQFINQLQGQLYNGGLQGQLTVPQTYFSWTGYPYQYYGQQGVQYSYQPYGYQRSYVNTVPQVQVY